MVHHDILSDIDMRLRREGWAVLRDANKEVFDDLTNALAEPLYDSDVRLDQSYTHRVTKPLAIPYHCDSPRAHFIAWFCLSPGTRKVPLKLVDALKVAGQLSNDQRATLAATRLGFNCRISKRLCTMPVLSSPDIEKDTLVFYNPWNHPKNLSEAKGRALAIFKEEIERAAPIAVDFDYGDILIVDNHRIVHARDALDEDSERHLLRRLMAVPALELPIKQVPKENVI